MHKQNVFKGKKPTNTITVPATALSRSKLIKNNQILIVFLTQLWLQHLEVNLPYLKKEVVLRVSSNKELKL
jgi:hypothetical protein